MIGLKNVPDTNIPRTMVAAVTMAAILVVSATAGVAATGSTATPTANEEYSVVQGDTCYPIEPLGEGHQTPEEFYDYRTPDTEPSAYSYSSHGTTHLQEDDTSAVFLHEGADGLSLVFVHDQYDGDTLGGAVTMQINNLPEDGEWVVEDDDYDGADVTFDHRETSSRMTWVWTESRTDGGVFNGGLDDEFAIEVIPRFNDEADYRVYDGEVTDWDVISGPSYDRERMSLEMDRPIVIQSGGCTSVTDLTVDKTVMAGGSIEIEATAENDGASEETMTIPVTVDGEPVDEHEVTLEPGETTTLSTEHTIEESGTYTVSVGEQDTDVTVDAEDGLPGFGITAAVLAALVAAVIARRRS